MNSKNVQGLEFRVHEPKVNVTITNTVNMIELLG
jgi:hypothetical protein